MKMMVQWYRMLINGSKYNLHFKLYTGFGARYISMERREFARNYGVSVLKEEDYYTSPLIQKKKIVLPTLHLGLKMGFMKK